MAAMSTRRLAPNPAAIGLTVGISLFLMTGVGAAPQGPQGAAPTPVAAAATNEWLTWGYDQERTLWNRAEKTLGKDNVGQLALKWNDDLVSARIAYHFVVIRGCWPANRKPSGNERLHQHKTGKHP